MISLLDLGASYRELQSEINAAVHRVLDSSLCILCPEVKSSRTATAEYCGAAHAAGLANGHDALICLVARLWDLSFMKKTAWTALND